MHGKIGVSLLISTKNLDDPTGIYLGYLADLLVSIAIRNGCVSTINGNTVRGPVKYFIVVTISILRKVSQKFQGDMQFAHANSKTHLLCRRPWLGAGGEAEGGISNEKRRRTLLRKHRERTDISDETQAGSQDRHRSSSVTST